MSETSSPTKQTIRLRREEPASRMNATNLATVGQVRHVWDGITLREFLMVACIIGFVALVGLAQLLESAQVTSAAYQVNDMRATAERLRQENSALRLEIAGGEQLTRVEQRAAALGLERAKSVQFIHLVPSITPAPSQTPEAR